MTFPSQKIQTAKTVDCYGQSLVYNFSDTRTLLVKRGHYSSNYNDHIRIHISVMCEYYDFMLCLHIAIQKFRVRNNGIIVCKETY